MIVMRIVAAVAVLVASLLAVGCSSTIPVKVDSIVSPGNSTDKTYRWYSGMQGVPQDDLYFREFSSYFRSVLKQRGFSESKEDNAAVAIYFSYGVSPGKRVQYTTSSPIYDWFGGDTIVYVETKDEGGEATRSTRTITTPVYRRMVGVDVATRSYTLYTSYAVLEAKRYRSGVAPKEMKTLWKTTVSTTARSNDLRTLMPVLATAAAPYIGVDTGVAKIVKIKKNDPELERLKQQSPL